MFGNQSRPSICIIFTFMHNNFPQPIDELKLEMNRILRWIHDAY